MSLGESEIRCKNLILLHDLTDKGTINNVC